MRAIIGVLIRSVYVGLGAMILSAAIPSEFCMCGNGRGIPFRYIHPHSANIGIKLYDRGESEIYLDFIYILYDAIFWTLIALMCMGLWHVFRRLT